MIINIMHVSSFICIIMTIINYHDRVADFGVLHRNEVSGSLTGELICMMTITMMTMIYDI